MPYPPGCGRHSRASGVPTWIGVRGVSHADAPADQQLCGEKLLAPGSKLLGAMTAGRCAIRCRCGVSGAPGKYTETIL